ncbi:MAG TPA: M20/M25/M40 family metallo-hydrolase, partial [Steroidobacteraceae bacterium]
MHQQILWSAATMGLNQMCALALGIVVAISARAADPAVSQADLAAAAALRDHALQANDAYAIVESLTTEVGPRPAGSDGDRAAVAWAQRTFERLGFASVHTLDVTVPHWIRGASALKVVGPYPQPMPALAIGGSVGTPEDGIQAEAIEIADLDALKALPAGALERHIAYFSQRMERTRDGAGYRKAVQVRARGASAAAALGALAIVIRSIGTDWNRLPHTGALVYDVNSPRIPAVAISNPDADSLERMFAAAKPVTLALNVATRELPDAHSADVIGEIPGTDRAREVVLLGAHLDCWDPGVGAIDDGAGVAIVMAAARLLRDIEPKPARTVRVVLFADEESGLSGARAYTAQGPLVMAEHAIAMEADLGSGPVWRLDSAVA